VYTGYAGPSTGNVSPRTGAVIFTAVTMLDSKMAELSNTKLKRAYYYNEEKVIKVFMLTHLQN
jgi:hypothetical protein